MIVENLIAEAFNLILIVLPVSLNNKFFFSYSKSKFAELPQFVDDLHKNGLHYIPIIDPAISSSEKKGTYKPYEIGLEMNIFIQNVSGYPFNGRVWTNGKTVWPDFTNPKVKRKMHEF